MKNSKVYHLSIEAGVPSVVNQTSTPLQYIDGMNMNYANLAEISEKGLTLARGQVAPGEEVTSHAGHDQYALFVLTGTGTLTLCDSDHVVVEEIKYEPGSLIIFPPEANHGWINDGEEPLEWFGVNIT